MKKILVFILLTFITQSALLYSQQWTVIPSPSPGAERNILRGVGAITSNDVWAVGVYGQLPEHTLIEHWDGVNWTVINSPNPGAQYNDLFAVRGLSSNNVYAVGNYSDFGNSQMMVLHWDGSSWTQQNTPTVTGGSSLENIVIFGPNDIYAGGFKAVGAPGPTTGTLVAHWNGSNWSIENTPNQSMDWSNFITDMKGLSSDNIWAVGYSRSLGETHKTMVLHKTGSTWAIVPVPNPGLESFLFSVDVIADNDVWATGNYNDNGNLVPLFLHYDGNTWSIINSPEGGYGTIHNSANDIWSTGSGFVHYNGSVWTSVNAAIPLGGAMGSTAKISPIDMWAVGRYVDGSALKTLTMHFGSLALTFNLKALIQGFYNPATDKMVRDTVKVFLRSASSPYAVIDSSRGILDSNGTGSFTFSNAANSVSYFIVIRHRNGLETWSAAGNSFNSGNLSYDFTTASSQAYGNNQTLSGTKYSMYGGDVNQDGTIDLSDLGVIDNDVFNFNSGYITSDVNGDGIVDISDLEIADNNAINFIVLQRP